MIRLVVPTAEMEPRALAFKQSFFDAGEGVINGSFKLDQERYSYAEWLSILESSRSEETANPRFGESDTFFAENEDGELVGIVNVRYELTAFYQNSVHIGLSVVPARRRRGYGAEILRAALALAGQHGLAEVKLVCLASNAASRATILKCGGRLNRVFGDGEDLKEEYVLKTTE